MNSIAILGCGWLGERIGKSFIRKGWKINASSRDIRRLIYFKDLGFHPFKIDIEDCHSISSDFFDVDFLIISTTNKNPYAHEKLLTTIKKSNVKKIFFISSTSVYQKPIVDLTINSPLVNSPLVEVEKKYLKSKKTYILRCGGLIGDNRQPGNFFKKGATIKNPHEFVRLIHYNEIISRIKSLIENDIKQVVHNLIRETKENRFEFYSKAYHKFHKVSGDFKKSSPTN